MSACDWVEIFETFHQAVEIRYQVAYAGVAVRSYFTFLLRSRKLFLLLEFFSTGTGSVASRAQMR